MALAGTCSCPGVWVFHSSHQLLARNSCSAPSPLCSSWAALSTCPCKPWCSELAVGLDCPQSRSSAWLSRGVLQTKGPHREDHLPSLPSQASGQVTVSEIPTKMWPRSATATSVHGIQDTFFVSSTYCVSLAFLQIGQVSSPKEKKLTAFVTVSIQIGQGLSFLREGKRDQIHILQSTAFCKEPYPYSFFYLLLKPSQILLQEWAYNNLSILESEFQHRFLGNSQSRQEHLSFLSLNTALLADVFSTWWWRIWLECARFIL